MSLKGCHPWDERIYRSTLMFSIREPLQSMGLHPTTPRDLEIPLSQGRSTCEYTQVIPIVSVQSTCILRVLVPPEQVLQVTASPCTSFQLAPVAVYEVHTALQPWQLCRFVQLLLVQLVGLRRSLDLLSMFLVEGSTGGQALVCTRNLNKSRLALTTASM